MLENPDILKEIKPELIASMQENLERMRFPQMTYDDL
jgi:hypothetical protein